MYNWICKTIKEEELALKMQSVLVRSGARCLSVDRPVVVAQIELDHHCLKKEVLVWFLT